MTRPSTHQASAAAGPGGRPMPTADGVLAVARELAVQLGLDGVVILRERFVLLVFGSRPGIKSALQQRLGAVARIGP